MYKVDSDEDLNIPRFLLINKIPLSVQIENLKKQNTDLALALEECIDSFNGKDYEKGFWPTMDKAVEALENHKKLMKEV